MGALCRGRGGGAWFLPYQLVRSWLAFLGFDLRGQSTPLTILGGDRMSLLRTRAYGAITAQDMVKYCVISYRSTKYMIVFCGEIYRRVETTNVKRKQTFLN